MDHDCDINGRDRDGATMSPFLSRYWIDMGLKLGGMSDHNATYLLDEFDRVVITVPLLTMLIDLLHMNVNACNSKGVSLLHSACKSETCEPAEILCEYGPCTALARCQCACM